MNAYLRSDLIGVNIQQEIKTGRLIRVGFGIYYKAKTSFLTGKIVPVDTFDVMLRNCLIRLGVKTGPTKADLDYVNGISTQVPTGRAIGVYGRLPRKIGYDGVFASYELIPDR